MLSFILLILTTVITSALTGFLNHKLNFNIQGFSIFIIFPIGAAIVGALATSGLAIGQKIQKTVIKPHFTVIAIIFGLLSFFTATFADYKFFLNDIESHYSKELSVATQEEKTAFYDSLSFFNYIKKIHDSSTINLSVRSSKSIKIDNSIVSIISFWLSVIGGGLGGLIVSSIAIGDRTKDSKTKEYRDLKYITLTDEKEYEKLEKLLSSKNFTKELSLFISNHPHNKSLSSSSHAKVKILKTRSSGEGQVMIEHHIQNGKNNTIKSKQEKLLQPSEVDTLMQTILTINPKESF